MPSLDTERSEALDAAAGGAAKRAYVRRIFSEIAPRYDLLNHLLSLAIDRRWRRAAIAALRRDARPTGVLLDVCAGTLDVSAALAREPAFAGSVIALDFAEAMLRRGAAKIGRERPAGAVRPVVADALALPIADATADGAIVAFGVRNFDDLDAGLRELHRVLAPGGRLVILEFTTPPSAIVRALYHLYFHHVLPTVGRLISGHRTAYRYLPESVASFPTAPDLAIRLRRAGFAQVGFRYLTFGVAALHWGERAGATRREVSGGAGA
jgi:demethylmenaquinone methyltransferase/2-methoxy-6-polyprenyl-1,4-benzoquinol methylase